MIGITTQLFDLQGVLIVPDRNIKNPNNRTKSRRASVTKTLDGGAYSLDFGYSSTDNDFFIEFIGLSKDEISTLEYIIEYHSRSLLCTETGAFLCVLNKLKILNNSVQLNFLVLGDA